MDYESMTLAELKAYAKSIGVSAGNIGKEKLIAKIKSAELENKTLQAVIDDHEIDEVEEHEDVAESPVTEESSVSGKEEINEDVPVHEESVKTKGKPVSTESLLESISSAIDELDDASDEKVEESVELPMNEQIPVKSICYGGLLYRNHNNTLYRWPTIGSIQYMTVGELMEMNNYNPNFLRKPLVILMDERAVRKFRLTSVYENVAKINNLTAIFSKDLKTIEKVIDDVIKVNMRDILVSKVRQMYKTKKLKDINVIRLLERKLQFDLSDAE